MSVDLSTLSETEHGQEMLVEFTKCVKNYRQRYFVYPICIAVVGGMFYNPKGSMARVILKRLACSYSIWFLGSFTLYMRGVSGCRGKLIEENNRRIDAEKRGIILDDTGSPPDLTFDRPPASDKNSPKTSVDDPFFSGFQHSIYEDFKPYGEETSRPKKSATYDDLWEMEKRRNEPWNNPGKWNDVNSADTRKPQRSRTNEYGDPIY